MAKAKKLPSGKWRVQVFLGKDAEGKQIRRSITAPTKKEAEQQAALLAALREKDEEAHDALIAEVFTDFETYDNDPEKMERVHERLLQLLS